MTEAVRSSTRVDLLLGGLQVLVGPVILDHTATATKLSRMLVGWSLFATRVFVLALSLFQTGDLRDPIRLTAVAAGASEARDGCAPAARAVDGVAPSQQAGDAVGEAPMEVDRHVR